VWLFVSRKNSPIRWRTGVGGELSVIQLVASLWRYAGRFGSCSHFWLLWLVVILVSLNSNNTINYVGLFKYILVALYGAETWSLRKADQIYLESFEMWRWRTLEKIIWTDCVRNEELLRTVK